MVCAPTDARIICTKRIVRYEVNCNLDENGRFANRPSMSKRVVREEEMLYKVAPLPMFDEIDFVKMEGEEYRVETIRYNVDDDINEVLVNKIVIEYENKEEAEKELVAKDKAWSKQCFAVDDVATMFVEMLGKQVGRMDYAKVSAFLKALKSYEPIHCRPHYSYNRVNYNHDRLKSIGRLVQDNLAAGWKVNHNHSHLGVTYEE